MTYASSLDRDAKKRLEEQVFEIIQTVEDVGSSQVTRVLVQDLRLAAEDGDTEAERILDGLAADGARTHVSRVLKADRSIIRLSSTGTAVSVPARIGVQAVDALGQKQRWYQQPLWWEMPWQRFMEMIASIEGQRDRLSVEIAAFREVLAYRERFPDSRTPMEACERAGVDPRNIGEDTKAA